jgi:cell division protein ZipA
LRFGEMSIFHRHEQANGSGSVQFSMANSVAPGVFDLDTINDFSTPSVSFFMSVPGAKNSMQAFEAMVETAQCLVKNLAGEMRDESRSVMTLQTLEHSRQKIRELERRQLTRSTQ